MVIANIIIFSASILLIDMAEDERIIDVEHVSECVSAYYCILLVFNNYTNFTEISIYATYSYVLFDEIDTDDDIYNQRKMYFRYRPEDMPKYHSKVFCDVIYSNLSAYECKIEGIMANYDKNINNYKLVCREKKNEEYNLLNDILPIMNYFSHEIDLTMIQKTLFNCISKNITNEGFDIDCLLRMDRNPKTSTINLKFNNRSDVVGNILKGLMPESIKISIKVTKNELKDLNYDIFTLDFKWNNEDMHGDFAVPPRFLRNVTLVADHGCNITSFTNISFNLKCVNFSSIRVKVISEKKSCVVKEKSHYSYLEAFVQHDGDPGLCVKIKSSHTTSILATTDIIVPSNFSKPHLLYQYDIYLNITQECKFTKYEAEVIKVFMDGDFLQNFTFHIHTNDSRYVLEFKSNKTFFDHFDIYTTICNNSHFRKYNITIHSRKYNLTKDNFSIFRIFVYFWDKYFNTMAFYKVLWDKTGKSFTLKLENSEPVKFFTRILVEMLWDRECSHLPLKYGFLNKSMVYLNESTINKILNSSHHSDKIKSECKQLKSVTPDGQVTIHISDKIFTDNTSQITKTVTFTETPKVKTDVSFLKKEELNDKIKELINKMMNITIFKLIALRYANFTELKIYVYQEGLCTKKLNVTIYMQLQKLKFFHSNLTNTDKISGSFNYLDLKLDIKTNMVNISHDMIESNLSRIITVIIEENKLSFVNYIMFRHYSPDIEENTFHIHIWRRHENSTSKVTCLYEIGIEVAYKELSCSCYEFPCAFMFSYNKKIISTTIIISIWFWLQVITILVSIGFILKVIFFDRYFQKHKLFNYIRTLGVCFTFVYIFFIVKEIYKTSTQQVYFVLALLHGYFTISTYLTLLSIIFEQYMNISEEIYVKYNFKWISIVLPWVIAFIWIVPTSILIYKNHQDSFISHSIRDRCIILPIFLLVLGIYIFLLIRKKNKKKLVTYEAFTNVTNKQIKMALLFLMSLLTIGWIFQFMIGLTDIFIEISQICNCAHGIALFVGLQFKTFHIKKLKILTKN